MDALDRTCVPHGRRKHETGTLNLLPARNRSSVLHIIDRLIHAALALVLHLRQKASRARRLELAVLPRPYVRVEQLINLLERAALRDKCVSIGMHDGGE